MLVQGGWIYNFGIPGVRAVSLALLPLPPLRNHPIRDLVVRRLRDDFPGHKLTFVRVRAVLDDRRAEYASPMPGSDFSSSWEAVLMSIGLVDVELADV